MAKRPIRRATPEGINVTRIEYENLESAVRRNAREIERLHRRIDELLERIERLSRRSA